MAHTARQCEHRLPSGARCRAHARTNDRFCFFHSAATLADRRRARRAGGVARSQGATVLPGDTTDLPLNDTHNVCALLAESINQVRRGQLDPRVANAVGYLASILLGALQQGPLEERLQRLEATLDLKREERTRPQKHESARIRETN
jgi:hypothetical protein